MKRHTAISDSGRFVTKDVEKTENGEAFCGAAIDALAKYEDFIE